MRKSLRFRRRRPTRRWRRRRGRKMFRNVKFCSPPPPRVYKVKHKILDYGALQWEYGTGQEELQTMLIPLMNAVMVATPLVAYLKAQYSEWLINKVEVIFSNLDGGITSMHGRNIDEATRDVEIEAYYPIMYSYKSLHETHKYVKMKRVVDKQHKASNLDNPIENYKALYPVLREKVPSYKKYCKFTIYPKCTKPGRTADKFWDNTTNLIDMVMLQAIVETSSSWNTSL